MHYFHPVIQKWFRRKFNSPTAVQQQSWPLIRDGKHLLVTAPTGSGKTLTAFLWSLNQLFESTWKPGQIRILYVSPLKALNNDIQRNLTGPLSELVNCFEQSGLKTDSIRVAVRSGDTPQSERRQMLRTPPEILITTPETLNNLLTSKNGRQLFTGLKTVILDEIHAVIGTKRGTHLITAVERLVEFSGEFQRLALSATVNPLDQIAAFVGGFQMSGRGNGARYRPRTVAIVKSPLKKQYDIQVDFPTHKAEPSVAKSLWPGLIKHLKKVIKQTEATLIFANSRRLTEKITRLLNENEDQRLAYAHHGSLSKEIRLAVEQKLKQSELKAIVATSSLELGIDVGGLDRVALVQTPMSVAASIQRIGRAGHGVDEISHGVLYPIFGLDLVHAAAMADAITAADVEKVLPVESPLDVLTQVILSMTCYQERHIDDLYALIKTSFPYRRLSRKQFDLIINMLEGRYADVRIKELSSKLYLDRLSGIIKAKRGTDFLLYKTGGTIPDRGYFALRLDGSGNKIGELDEEFVWERSVGDLFAMGSQIWQVQSISHNDVVVTPAADTWDIIPFWKAEGQNRNAHFSEKIGEFLEQADPNLQAESFAETLARQYFMTPVAADQLIAFLRRQKEKTGAELPHRHHILVEHVNAPDGKCDARQVILHTLWGNRLNRPFALALSAAWENEQNSPLQVFSDNDGVILMLPGRIESQRLFELVTAQNLEKLLLQKLPQTGLFGTIFRESAARALLLPKYHFDKRMPLWLNRLRSKKLLKSIQSYDDFPILIETLRSCLRDEFDLGALRYRLEEIQDGDIRFSETYSNFASPFSASLVFRQTNTYMYTDDTPLAADGSNLKKEYIQDLIDSSHLRPRLPEDLLNTFRRKIQRSQAGYAPETEIELVEWLKERLMIPLHEWEELSHSMDISATKSALLFQVVNISWSDCGPFITHLEILPRFCKAFSIDLNACRLSPLGSEENNISKIRDDYFKGRLLEKIKDMYHFSFEEDETPEFALISFIGQWLSYYGPLPKKNLQKIWGLDDKTLKQIIQQLVDTEQILVDFFSQSGETPEICDRKNLERLLFLYRQLLRPTVNPLPLKDLPLFTAQWQGVGQRSEGIKTLKDRLEQLFGLPLPTELWEEVIWPSRLGEYQTSWLDKLLQTSDLSWFGCDGKKIAFSFLQDLELFQLPSDTHDFAPLPSDTGKFSFFDAVDFSKLNSARTAEMLWENTWQGKISNDSFEVIRRGRYHKFNPEPTSKFNRSSQRRPRHGLGRNAFNRWQSSRPLLGNWFALPRIEQLDPLETEELIRDRVRQLLKRYGILFRQLLARELPGLQWKSIFKSLRLMEFSGEVFSGHFFEGISGLQFASKKAMMDLQRPLCKDFIFWLNAADPASFCGVDLPELKQSLPQRKATTFLVYQGSRLILVAKRNGKTLEFNIQPDDPLLEKSLQLFKILLGRDFNPLKKIIIETVNGENVLKSFFLTPLEAFGFNKSYNCLELYRNI